MATNPIQFLVFWIAVWAVAAAAVHFNFSRPWHEAIATVGIVIASLFSCAAVVIEVQGAFAR